MFEPEFSEPSFFELTITQFTPKLRTEEWRIETVQELDERLVNALSESLLAIEVNCVVDDADWGLFVLLLNEERALVHLMGGPCVTAIDPDLIVSEARPVTFRDDAGFLHERPFERTISREQGVQALRHWLPRGERLPSLAWSSDEARLERSDEN